MACSRLCSYVALNSPRRLRRSTAVAAFSTTATDTRQTDIPYRCMPSFTVPQIKRLNIPHLKDKPPPSLTAALNTLAQAPPPPPPPPSPDPYTPRHAFPWDLLLHIYVRDRFSEEALLVDQSKFITANDWIETEDPRFPLMLHDIVSRTPGLVADLHVGNVFISMYVNCGVVDVGRKVFDGMSERDVVTFNAIILGYASAWRWGELSQILELVPQGMDVNNLSWNTVVAGYLHMGNHSQVLRLISEMAASMNAPDSVTFLLGLNACSGIRSLRHGMEIHGLAIRTQCDALITVTNALITMYSRCDRIVCAHILYELYRSCASPYMRSWDTWNSVVETFCDEDRVEEAFWVFRDMVKISPHRIHNTTLAIIISLCTRIGDVRRARELHSFMTTHRYEGVLDVWNLLIDMYAKMGMLSTAQRVLYALGFHYWSPLPMALTIRPKVEGIKAPPLLVSAPEQRGMINCVSYRK